MLIKKTSDEKNDLDLLERLTRLRKSNLNKKDGRLEILDKIN